MKEQSVSALTHRGILQLARQERNLTQGVLADRMNMKRNSLCQNLSRPRISLEMFGRIMNAMEYDIVIVDRTTGEAAWKLDTWSEDEFGV